MKEKKRAGGKARGKPPGTEPQPGSREESRPETGEGTSAAEPAGNGAAPPSPAAEESRPVEPPPAAEEGVPFPIVGVGASAGGLKALQGFFDRMPADSGLAFAVIQHLDPKHASIMTSILSRHTRMEVLEVQDETPVEPDRVYVKPPGKDLVVSGRKLWLVQPPEGQGAHLPIDTFFRSLAESQGEKAVCVVLSGAGRDGTLGLKAVKGAGGLVIVQDEEQAEYGGMPGSAIGTGQADFILPVERMPEEILRYTRHPSIRKVAAEPESRETRYEADFQKILMTVRTHIGTDFTHYKCSTVRRRIERRLALRRIESLPEYIKYLRGNPEEVHALFRDLTINVTSFFRDPEAWRRFKEVLIGGLFSQKQEGDDLRAWVAGCSTGEEAYSLAITLMEAMEATGKQVRVKIFATDVNEDAVETARAAVYPDTIAADVRHDLLERFFVKRDASYRVRDIVREAVVFAVHDITRDPPFSQLDLVVCRNLLIYMDAVLQRTVIPLLHYGLRPGALLFLGTSESIGELIDLFTPADGRWKIFRALKADTERYLGHLRAVQPGAEANQPREEKPAEPEPKLSPRRKGDNARDLVERIIAERYAPPAVLINPEYEILYFHGNTERYLAPPKGQPGYNLLKVARRELQHRLRRALQEAETGGRAVAAEGLQVSYGGKFILVDLKVIPFRDRDEGYTLVTFEERARPQEREAEPAGESADARLRLLQHELYATRQDLQATIEELETSNEELKSANEELQANNEELQSTNEELETSREELQSTNEELETVNAELQKKNEELSRAHNDILNLFAISSVGTIFLDTQMRIKRFTPAVKRVFSLIDSDVGRPITDLSSRLNYPQLAADARNVLESLERSEREVSTGEGQWFAVEIRPYRTSNNIIDGVAITFTNVTDLRKAEREATSAREYVDSIMATMREPLIVLDTELRVVSANRAFYRVFQTLPQETEGREIYQLGTGQWDIPELRSLLEQVIPENFELEDYRVEHEFPRVGRRVMLLNARRIERDGQEDLILLAFEDRTGDREKHGGSG